MNIFVPLGYCLISIYIFKYSKFLFGILSIFILLNGWRLVSSSYVTNMGPIYAPELSRELINVFPNDILLFLIVLLFFFGFVITFSPKKINELKSQIISKNKETHFLVFRKFSLLVSFLYVIFVIICFSFISDPASYPIFSGLHRRLFMVTIENSILIKLFFKTLSYASIFLGSALSLNMIYFPWNTWKTWVPFMGWFSSIIFLLILGHRFSSLIWCCYFFSFPLTINLLTSKSKKLLKLLILSLFLFSAVVSLMFAHSFIIVGSHSNEKVSYLKRRLLIDQTQLFNSISTRIFASNWDEKNLAQELILNTPLTSKIHNRSAQLLMFQEYGDAANDHWNEHHILSVGYPENIMEITGGGAVFLVTVFLSLFLAISVYWFFMFLLSHQYIQAFLLIAIINPLFALFAGGSAHSIISLRFLLKITLVGVIIMAINLMRLFLNNKNLKIRNLLPF